MSRTRKVLITMLALGALAAVGVGTYATFSAQTVNQNNSFATGTIVLTNNVNNASVCYSSGPGAGSITGLNSGNCNQVVSSDLNVGGGQAWGGVVLQNKGSLGGSTLTVQAPSCTPGDRGGEASTGTANPCTKLDVALQQVQYYGSTSGITNGATVTTISTVAIPFAIPTATSLTLVSPTGQTVAVTTNGVTAAGATSITVNSFSTVGVSYPAGSVVYGGTSTCIYGGASCVFDVTKTVSTLVTAGAQTIGSGLASQAYAAFVVAFQLDSSVDNTFQGRTATWNLNWTLNQ